MASATPAYPPHSHPDHSAKDGSPDPSAVPSVANGDQQRRTSFNFLRRVRPPCVQRAHETLLTWIVNAEEFSRSA
jgi:hypothetical protein